MYPDQAAVPAQPVGFLAALFDLSFISSFITIKLIKVLYVLAIGIAALGALMVGITVGSAVNMILGLLIVPLFFLFYVLLARVALETVIIFFRIAEELGQMNRSVQAKRMEHFRE